MIKTVGIYCASSDLIDSFFFNEAEELGLMLGKRGIHVVNGAGNKGLMRVVTDAVLSTGGEVTGVIPGFMVKKGLCHQGLTTVIETKTMHERKKKMADLSDAVIALPGGYGTMEELLEIITWRQLGLFNNTIIILNTRHFYDPLLDMLKRTVTERFVRQEHAQLWHVADTPENVIAIIQ